MHLYVYLFVISFFASAGAFASNDLAISTIIEKTPSGDWTVEYRSLQPMKRLAFSRNPDQSRIERWLPLSKDYEIISDENQGKRQEFVVRKDRAKFLQVKFSLTPTYKHLTKDYAPFSPFSDGGMLFHTGRFFACINYCNDQQNQWQMEISFPKEEHSIVNGNLYHSNTRWIDKNDGMNVYVGKQKPIETDAFIAVIDVGLPEKITTSLNSDIPKMMNYFEQRLGKLALDEKPMLFASYANVKGHSSQGGTLPNQVFMHWNVDNLDKSVSSEKFLHDTLWFFGHESAHLYQASSKGQLGEAANQSWIHEGHAELLAADVLTMLYPDSINYVNNRLQQMKSSCIDGLGQFALVDAADIGKFGYYYSCGIVIHGAIESVAKEQSLPTHSAYIIWNRFRSAVDDGAIPGQETFLAITDEVLNSDMSARILTLIRTKHDNAEQVVNNLVPLGE